MFDAMTSPEEAEENRSFREYGKCFSSFSDFLSLVSGAVAALQHTWMFGCWSVSAAVGAENTTNGTAGQVGALWEGAAFVRTLPSIRCTR